MQKFYVFKESGTFSDSLECLGLARILKITIEKVSDSESCNVVIEDKDGFFELTSNIDIPETIESINFFDFMPYVTKKNEKTSELRFNYINYDEEKEKRDAYSKLKKDDKIKSKNPPRADYDIIRLYAGMNGYRLSFSNLRLFQKKGFQKLLSCIFQYYKEFKPTAREKSVKELNKYIKDQKIANLKKVNALQDINPDRGKGANQPKANSISPKSYSKMLWFRELLKFLGGWEGITSRYFDKDYKTYVLNPNDISVEYLNQTFKSLKKSIRGNSSLKTDIYLSHQLTYMLIIHHKNYNESWNYFEPQKAVSGFSFAYYKNLGQKPAVTNIGFLGLPNFIKINDEATGNKWIEILKEHQKRINCINEKSSSNVAILQDYRNFISAGDFKSFFEFCFGYAAFLIASIIENKYYVEPFSVNNLEELMKTNESFENIFSNKGFQAIAQAIRNSTIIPIIHKNKKDVIFGLSNKLKIASRNKETLASEISEFIQKYNESIMLKDFHRKKHHRYIKKEELEEFFKLLDSENSSKTIAGMLVAFGYAKDPTVKETEINDKEKNND